MKTTPSVNQPAARSAAWAKVASVTRSGRFFYHRASDRCNVVQAWAGPMAGRWHVSGQTVTFATAREAMNAAPAV